MQKYIHLNDFFLLSPYFVVDTELCGLWIHDGEEGT